MAWLNPTPLKGCSRLEPEVLEADRKSATAFGPVSLGKMAVYFRAFPAPRYAPLNDISLAYLRVHEANGGGDFDIDATYAGFVAVCGGFEKEVLFSNRLLVEQLLEALNHAGVRAGVGAQKEENYVASH